MAEGVEIVIRPKHIERAIFIIVIIVLAVLLIIKWNGGGSGGVDTNETAEVDVESEINTMNETLNASVEVDLCTNAIKDQDETDVDCGGEICDACGEFEECHKDSDCVTEFCKSWKCAEATCDDGEKNQDESNIDCGGTCGGHWWSSDSSCHVEEEPSGRLTITLKADVGESELSGNAVLNSVTLTIDNGLSNTLFLTATLYALSPAGASIFTNLEGDIDITTIDLEDIVSGDKLIKVIDLTESTYRVLKATSPEDEYQILVELRDQDGDLVKRVTWTNK